VPPGWIPEAAFWAELERQGSTVRPRQVERWANEELIPRALQVPRYKDGRVNGSEVWRSPESVRQITAVERIYSVKESREYAGMVLWLAGFTVGDRYWRPRFVRVEEWSRQIAASIKGLFNAAERKGADTAGEQFASRDEVQRGLSTLRRRVGQKGLAGLLDVIAQVVSGAFRGLDAYGGVDEAESRSETLHRAIGIDARRTNPSFGISLNISSGMEATLRAISAALYKGDNIQLSDNEILLARNDIVNAMRIAYCLDDSFEWIYGPNALGLRFLAHMFRDPSADLLIFMIIGFARLRRFSNDLKSSEEIGALADAAEVLWLLMSHVRDLNNDPQLGPIANDAMIRCAFGDSNRAEQLVKQLKARSPEEPKFHPWNQWRKSSKTMPIGLLVMSIGSPSQISVEDIRQRVLAAESL
jgi:hypothetical protein